MQSTNSIAKMTNYRWTIVALLFVATTINYLDRQVLSLTWDEFIMPEFHWNENHYGTITSIFSIVYAISMLFAGSFVDWMGTKKGFLWAIGVWSVGACMHALCGVVTESWVGLHSAAELAQAVGDVAVLISTVSMYAFIVARIILAIGEAGNFPAAIKVTAEYFPKKDRAYATSIFNAGASVGALIAPLSIPFLAKAFGWEMSFIVIGALGFLWMGFWVFLYKKPEQNKHVNSAELNYILSDRESRDELEMQASAVQEKKVSFVDCFKYKQTWAFAFGKFMTDGVWWFFLFWTPSYLNTQFGIKTSAGLGVALIFTLYALATLSIYGGKLPSIIIKKTGLNPYAARMKAMFVFCIYSTFGSVGSAFRNLLTMVSDYPDRFRMCGSSIVVGKHIHDSWRYVPETCHCNSHRDWWYGWWSWLYDSAKISRKTICLCRRNQDDFPWI